MYSTSSVASAVTPSVSAWSGCARCSSLNSTSSVDRSSSNDSLASPRMTMCAPSPESAVAPISFAAGHPVSEPARLPPLAATATASLCGPRCDVSSAKWRRNGLSWSSPQATRLGKPKCVTIWIRMASTQHELNSVLTTVVHLIFDGECSFLPTPVSRDWRSPGKRSHERLQKPRGQPLPEIIGSRVHPELCEWLMGLPSGWTATLPSRRSETATLQSCSPSSAER